MCIKVLIVDDHAILRDGVKTLLSQKKGIFVIGEAENGREAVSLVKKLHPDLVIMDLAMPGLNGIDATRQIIRQTRKTKVIAFSMHADSKYVKNILKAGASGYVLKEYGFEELLDAIQTVISNKIFISEKLKNENIEDSNSICELSTREREVLQLLAEGKNTTAIASNLKISIRTVESHTQNIRKKLGKNRLTDLVQYSIKIGLVDVDT